MIETKSCGGACFHGKRLFGGSEVAGPTTPVSPTLTRAFSIGAKLFGTTVSLGIRVVVPCILGRSRLGKVEENFHEVSISIMINVIPFAVPVV